MLRFITRLTTRSVLLAVLCALAALALSSPVVAAQSKQKFKIAWTILLTVLV